uniref:Zgc:171971 n=1 Tax=Sinocyclocheilus anshuiensis TaxID=1608454 RepID=A0A671RK57_9TELE
MCEHGDGDAEASSSATLRPSFVLGRALPGRISLNPPPQGRLTSLRSRDLTLGGYKKKTFVPNVHSFAKLKIMLYKSINLHLLLTHGGAMIKYQIKFHQVNIRVPVFDLAGNWSVSNLSDCDPALVTKCIKKEKNDVRLNDPLSCDKFHKQRPIRLPLYQSCNFLSTDAASSFIEETASDNALKSAKAEQKYPVPVRGTSSCPQQSTVGELFQQLTVSDKEELLFIQLPDTIPGQPKPPSPEKPRKEGKTLDKRSSKIKALDQPDKAAVPVLSDFSEGLIGKLQMRKSGKVLLVMGNVTLDVSEGAAFSFLQQLACVRMSEGLTGDMMCLETSYTNWCVHLILTLLQEAKLPSDPSSASKS